MKMIPKKQEKNNKISGITIGYTDEKISSYGGIRLLEMFFEKIKLKPMLNRLIPIVRKCNSVVSVFLF